MEKTICNPEAEWFRETQLDEWGPDMPGPEELDLFKSAPKRKIIEMLRWYADYGGIFLGPDELYAIANAFDTENDKRGRSKVEHSGAIQDAIYYYGEALAHVVNRTIAEKNPRKVAMHNMNVDERTFRRYLKLAGESSRPVMETYVSSSLLLIAKGKIKSIAIPEQFDLVEMYGVVFCVVWKIKSHNFNDLDYIFSDDEILKHLEPLLERLMEKAGIKWTSVLQNPRDYRAVLQIGFGPAEEYLSEYRKGSDSKQKTFDFWLY